MLLRLGVPRQYCLLVRLRLRQLSCRIRIISSNNNSNHIIISNNKRNSTNINSSIRVTDRRLCQCPEMAVTLRDEEVVAEGL